MSVALVGTAAMNSPKVCYRPVRMSICKSLQPFVVVQLSCYGLELCSGMLRQERAFEGAKVIV
jgi:hypothetical protein